MIPVNLERHRVVDSVPVVRLSLGNVTFLPQHCARRPSARKKRAYSGLPAAQIVHDQAIAMCAFAETSRRDLNGG